jgi:hypothetical protein
MLVSFKFILLSMIEYILRCRDGKRIILDGEYRPNEIDMCDTSVYIMYLPRLCIPQHESQVPIGAIWRKSSEHGNASACIQHTRSS